MENGFIYTNDEAANGKQLTKSRILFPFRNVRSSWSGLQEKNSHFFKIHTKDHPITRVTE